MYENHMGRSNFPRGDHLNSLGIFRINENHFLSDKAFLPNIPKTTLTTQNAFYAEGTATETLLAKGRVFNIKNYFEQKGLGFLGKKPTSIYRCYISKDTDIPQN